MLMFQSIETVLWRCLEVDIQKRQGCGGPTRGSVIELAFAPIF
jgi:hypothetical protein